MQACTLAGKLNSFGAADSKDIPDTQASSDVEHSHEGQVAGPSQEQQECLMGCRPAWLPVHCDTHALQAFYEHADNSNDIFRVAARAVATVASAFYMRMAMHAVASGGVEPQSGDRETLLLEAWKPFQAVFKAVWWEQVPMPDDLSDEEAWRSQLKCAL